MEQFSITKKSRKNKNRKRERRNKPSLARLHTVLGAPVYKLCQTTQIVSSTNGASTLTFSPLGGTYYNVNDLQNASDFQNMATAYQVCRITGVTVVINRLISETQLTTVFPAGISSMYIAYYPTVSSTTIAASGIYSAENAMLISPFNNRQSRKTFRFPNIIAPSTPAISLTQFFSVNNISNVKGQFSIGSYGTGNASATSNIFTATFYFDVQFAVPF
jgi:hypothetical protein